MKLSQQIKWVFKILLGKELYFKKQIKCNKIFFGTEYGGYFICPDNISKASIVYSFGVGEDISFDKEVIEDIMNSDIEVEQILIEFHHRFPYLGKIKTKEAVKRLNEKDTKFLLLQQ